MTFAEGKKLSEIRPISQHVYDGRRIRQQDFGALSLVTSAVAEAA